jgi:hypothetical protein
MNFIVLLSKHVHFNIRMEYYNKKENNFEILH